jgi:hypothetical protein
VATYSINEYLKNNYWVNYTTEWHLNVWVRQILETDNIRLTFKVSQCNLHYIIMMLSKVFLRSNISLFQVQSTVLKG